MKRSRKNLIHRSAIFALGLSLTIGLAVPVAYLSKAYEPPLPPLPAILEVGGEQLSFEVNPEGRDYLQTAIYTFRGQSESEVIDQLKAKLKFPEWQYFQEGAAFFRFGNNDQIVVMTDRVYSCKAYVHTGYSLVRIWNNYMIMAGFMARETRPKS